ncbi:ATP-dependent DNA ligase [Amycolatopsis antarctica]|uniref:ATP-dependent DNA ligase n=1 Tax=Amycolatopsis antarctica TaxID=1854586 RepID=A0A263D0L1_9PSEU|nr:DNA primase small subunit domain-containing protein [Amycolatopsis antarctica]OZM71891.1 ATP-dependent DNA ligase [Amycolatopsis antarctica]
MTAHVEVTVPGPHGPRTLRVSNPDKLYFPERGLRKLDVVEYFLTVAPGVLEATGDRPTTLERWPGGVRPGAGDDVWRGASGSAFFQKRVPANAPPWVSTVRVPAGAGRTADQVRPTEPAVIGWAANLGTLAFHAYPVRATDLNHPDRLHIDLDPQPGSSFGDVVRIAGELCSLLGELGATGFPKTSGGRGVHVLVPIEPRRPLGEVRRAAIAISRELQRRLPRLTTIAWLRRDRGRHVFIDYNQSVGTIASAYSVRATPAATVSAPVHWAELAEADPRDFHLGSMPARFRTVGDPHAGLDSHRCSLEPMLEMADRDDRDGVGGDLP